MKIHAKQMAKMIFFPIYIYWKSLQLSILVSLTPGFEPKSGPSYQHDSRTARD
jgi:hypothetical protein